MAFERDVRHRRPAPQPAEGRQRHAVGLELRPSQIVALQRAAGNRAVSRLVAECRPAPALRCIQRVIVPIPGKGLKFGTKEFEEDRADVDRGTKGLKLRDGGQQESGSLANLPDSEKIYMHGHGAAGNVGGYSASELFDGLKKMGLEKTYKGVIVIAACQSGVRTGYGIGPSLAGQLAGLLSGEQFQAKVEGMTGNMIIDHHTGEIRIVTDHKAYAAELGAWEKKRADFDKRAQGVGKLDPAYLKLEQELEELEAENQAIRRRHTVKYELGGTVLRGESDDRSLLAGSLVIGLLGTAAGVLAYYYKH